MEPGSVGGIVGHLAAIRQAVTAWLEYENPPEGDAGQDEYLLRMATQDELSVPDVPEIMALLRESRAYNIPIFNGSLMDLPYLFHLELNTCVDAENEFYSLREVNRRLREKHNENKPGPQ